MTNCPLYHLLDPWLIVLLLYARRAGVAMIFLRFITVANRTDDLCAKILNVLSLIVGSLSTLFLSLVANFPEDQTHGVGLTHEVGAGVLFTAGCVFIVLDTAVTLRTRRVEIMDADRLAIPQRHWLRSLRWFECIRPVIALLSVIAWVLSK